jgi:hypothetical protein
MKYLADGRAVEVVQKLESGYLVQYYYSSGDTEDGLYLDRLSSQIVDRVFDTPPVEKYHESIQALKSEIDELRQNKLAVINECYDIQKQFDDARAKRAQHEQLRLLDDFIAGNITHYVEVEYSCPKIIDFKDDTARKELKLLSLFGASNGKLNWQLNQYRDGSGVYTTVIPTTSYEQALEIAKAYVSKKLEETRERPETRIVELADKWGVPVPVEYREKAKATKREGLLRVLNERKKNIKEIEQELSEL